mgnify:CR=1 FL=1
MENKMQIFNNDAFGELRTIEEDGKIMFVASDVAKMLGYTRPADAITAHCKGSVKRRLPTNGGVQEMKVIPEGDVYRLITHSKLPAAEKFESWVFDDVLPSIRKTGSYTKPNAVPTELQLRRMNVMEQNAAIRRAKVLLAIGKASLIDKYEQICQCKAAELVAGEQILPMPKTRKTYSATEIGEKLGVSANKIGRLANKYNLKTDKYGELCGDITSSGRQVQNFYYYEEAIEKFQELLNGGVAA